MLLLNAFYTVRSEVPVLPAAASERTFCLFSQSDMWRQGSVGATVDTSDGCKKS